MSGLHVSCRKGVGIWAATVLVAPAAAVFFLWGAAEVGAADFETIGKIGPKAVQLDVSVETAPEGSGGIPETIVRVKAPQQTYIVAVYIAPNGGTTLLIPGREIPDGLLEAGNDLVVLGPGSPLRLKESKKAADAPKVVFYASSKKLDLAPLKIPEKEPCLTVEASDVKNLKVLLEKIELFAADDTFNRKITALEPGAKLSLRLDAMGLPGAAKSRRPTDVLGSKGVKEEGPDLDKK